MVWGVCRRVLGHSHDAEDAFQATFLVLVRRGATVQVREQVGPWLHGVARLTARKAKATRAKRRAREAELARSPEPAIATSTGDDRLALLDREVGRLPEKYRIPILLCDLGGMAQKDAADRLGWAPGHGLRPALQGPGDPGPAIATVRRLDGPGRPPGGPPGDRSGFGELASPLDRRRGGRIVGSSDPERGLHVDGRGVADDAVGSFAEDRGLDRHRTGRPRVAGAGVAAEGGGDTPPAPARRAGRRGGAAASCGAAGSGQGGGASEHLGRGARCQRAAVALGVGRPASQAGERRTPRSGGPDDRRWPGAVHAAAERAGCLSRQSGRRPRPHPRRDPTRATPRGRPAQAGGRHEGPDRPPFARHVRPPGGHDRSRQAGTRGHASGDPSRHPHRPVRRRPRPACARGDRLRP